METVSFSIANYCVPCQAHCSYCLLSSCGQTSGVNYRQSTQFAHRVLAELSEKKPDIRGSFYIGYCMDTPDLWDYIRFSRVHLSPGAGFLQMNGFAFREEKELHSIMQRIHDEGVKLIDLTIYGAEEYHDRFAGRKGDFKLVMQMMSAAAKSDLPVNISIPLLQSLFINSAIFCPTARVGGKRYRINESRWNSLKACQTGSETLSRRFHIELKQNG